MGLFDKLFRKKEPAPPEPPKAVGAPVPPAAPIPSAPPAAPVPPAPAKAPAPPVAPIPPTPQTPPAPAPAAGQAGAPASDPKQDETEQLLTTLLLAYVEKKDRESFAALFKYLYVCEVWVPVIFRMSEEDQKQFLNVKKGDTISLKQFMGMKPDILKGADGSLYFPVFSEKSQAPDEYRLKFSWIRLPFLECVHMALGFPGVHRILINGFTHKIIFNEAILKALTQVKTEERALGKREFGLQPENEETKALRRALYDRIKWINYLEKAYLLRLSGEGEESYAVVIDDPKHKPQDLFTFIHKGLSWMRLSHPVDYVEYGRMKQKVEELGCQPFYIKRGKMCNMKHSLFEGHQIIIRTLYDIDGAEEEYRIEVRRDTESHYTFGRPGMAALKKYFQEKGQNNPLEGLQAYLKPYSASLDDAEAALVKLFADQGVVYRRSQADRKEMELLKSYVAEA